MLENKPRTIQEPLSVPNLFFRRMLSIVKLNPPCKIIRERYLIFFWDASLKDGSGSKKKKEKYKADGSILDKTTLVAK